MYIHVIVLFSPLPSSCVLLDCIHNHPVRYNCWDPNCHCSVSVRLQERFEIVLFKEYLGNVEHCGASVSDQCITGALPVHHQCITSASPVHHQCITSASPVYHQCITGTSPVYHQCITGASPVHHRCITGASSVSNQCKDFLSSVFAPERES